MTARPHANKSRPKKPEQAVAPIAPAPLPAVSSGSGAVTEAAAEKLTPEEQMERFAQELKNEDWGHQPC
jgi:hypothetical protein